jgi:hypothetical protein
MADSVSITERVFIAAPPEDVWAFTQNEVNRPLWKDFCPSPKILESRPCRLLRFEECGRLSGRWTYESSAGGTLWSQTNTLSLSGVLGRLSGAWRRFKLKRAMRESMRRVKEALEFSEDLSGSLHEDFF